MACAPGSVVARPSFPTLYTGPRGRKAGKVCCAKAVCAGRASLLARTSVQRKLLTLGSECSEAIWSVTHCKCFRGGGQPQSSSKCLSSWVLSSVDVCLEDPSRISLGLSTKPPWPLKSAKCSWTERSLSLKFRQTCCAPPSQHGCGLMFLPENLSLRSNCTQSMTDLCKWTWKWRQTLVKKLMCSNAANYPRGYGLSIRVIVRRCISMTSGVGFAASRTIA
eukprot:7383730-Prymnesium_polylepis.1